MHYSIPRHNFHTYLNICYLMEQSADVQFPSFVKADWRCPEGCTVHHAAGHVFAVALVADWYMPSLTVLRTNEHPKTQLPHCWSHKGIAKFRQVAWVALNHHGRRLENRHGDLGHGQLLVVRLLSRDDRGVGRQHEVDAGVGDQVGLELRNIHVQGSIEAQRCGQA